ncbi:MAG: MFS transporter [Phycisphaeraceae bacterium]
MNDTATGEAISKHDKLMFWGCFIALITTAFAFVSRLFLLGEWKEQFGLTGGEVGELAGIGIWPFAVSIIVFSLFIDKIGYKFAMIFSFAGYLIWSVIGVAAFFVADGAAPGSAESKTAYSMLYWGSFLLGLANGTVEAYINPVVATMFSKNKTKWLNILHAGWPGGLVIVGLITIAMAGTPWWMRIAIIAAPALVFFFMLVPLKFPANERVAAGVSYREMIGEFGMLTAGIVAFLLTLQLIQFFPNVSPFVFIVIGVACVVAVGVYTQKLGNPLLFVLALIMMPLATTEIGTDSWIEEIMKGVAKEAGFHSGLVLVYTSAIMCALRFCAGPIVHRLSPIGLLIASAALAAVGLFWLSAATGLLIIFAAATLYAFGKTFFWPTMLGIAGEQTPKGGALTLNALGGIGMLAVGTLGTVYIGVLQDTKQIEAVKASEEVQQAIPGIVKEDKLTVLTEKSSYGIIKYEAVDSAEVQKLTRPTKEEKVEDPKEGEPTTKTVALSDDELKKLPEEKQEAIAAAEGKLKEVSEKSAQGALANMAIFPIIMLVAYVIMFFYFKSKGGYQVQHLHQEGDLTPDEDGFGEAAAQK